MASAGGIKDAAVSGMVFAVSFLVKGLVLYQCGGKASPEQVGREGDVPGCLPSACLPDAQVQQGKEAGEGQDGHQPGCPIGDAQQGRQLDVPAADAAVSGKGDGEQEQEPGQASHGTVQRSL